MGKTAKETLLESAIHLFSERGYRDATIADIVEHAGANIAAVNYHYGSKDKLFVAAIRKSFEQAEEVYPISGGLSEDAPPIEKIAAFSRAILLRSFDPGPAGDFDRIMGRTVNVPNSPTAIIMEEVYQLALERLDGLLHAYLNTDSEEIVNQARMSLIALSVIVCRDSELMTHTLPQNEKDIQRFIDRQVTAAVSALSTFLP